eukprot:Partr_v1_DN28880_c1_g1_i1_m33894 putative vacuolar protein sorting 39 homolog (S. cerevisiae)
MKAFEDKLVISSQSRLDRLFPLPGDRSLIAASQSQLLIFSDSPNAGVGEDNTTMMSLSRSIPTFARKSVDQMEAVVELDMLVAMVDGCVCLYDLHSMALRSSLGRTRGCSSFVVTRVIEKVAASAAAIPQSRGDSSTPSVTSSVAIHRRQKSTTTPLSYSPVGTPPSSSLMRSRGLPVKVDEDDIDENVKEDYEYDIVPASANEASVELQGTPAIVIRLVVACKKRLLVYRWVDSDYLDVVEIPINDKVRSMAALGSYEICVALSRDYCLVDLQTRNLRVLFPIAGGPGASSFATVTASSNATATATPYVSAVADSTANSSSESINSVVSSNSINLSPSNMRPLVSRISNGAEVLVLKNNVSVFLGAGGTPSRAYGIPWSQIPSDIAYSYPYLMAIFPQSSSTFSSSSYNPFTSSTAPAASIVEVRNISTGSLMQQFPFEQAFLLSTGTNGRGPVFVASDERVWRLSPVSASQQVDQLVELGKFDDALDLLDQIDSIALDEKQAKLFRVNAMKAVHLFHSAQRYDDCFKLIDSLKIPILDLLSAFFPQLLSTNLKERAGLPVAGVNSPAIGGLRKAASASLSSSHATFTTLSSSASSPMHSSILQQLVQGYPKMARSPDTTAALSSLVLYLTERRQKFAKRIFSARKSNKSNTSVADLETELSIIDTTLMKAYLQTNPALIGPLLRVTNRVIVEDAEEVLTEAKRWNELVDLYRARDLHRRALLLLAKRSKASGSLSGPMPSVRYMQNLGREHFELVFEFSTPILQSHPDEGLLIFTEDLRDGMLQDSLSSDLHIPKDRILAHLEKIESRLAIQYLEHIIKFANDQTTDFHNKLASFYLDRLLNSRDWKDSGNQPRLNVAHMISFT